MSEPRTELPEYIKSLVGTELPNGYVIRGHNEEGPLWYREGASAYVLKATGALGAPKAIKILRQEKAREQVARDRFLDEVKKLQRLHHPNIVSVEDFGKLPATGLPYYVMEFVDGAPIDKWAGKKEAVGEYLEADAVCSLIRQVVTALAHVHSQDPPIYHLDLKPSNIIVSWDGTPKVGDFGLALARASTEKIAEQSLGGRPIASMHPRFQEMFSRGEINPNDLAPEFDLFGLGYTLSQVEKFLKRRLDNFRQYIFDAMVLRLTVEQANDTHYPGVRRRFRREEREGVPEYKNTGDVFEALDKMHNPSYHLVNVPELQMEPAPLPPVRIAGHTHVPTTNRLRELMDNPIFQRLEWMRQLDQVHHAYPGAEHTRREHALGVYYYTVRYMRRLLQEPYFTFHFTSGDVRATLLAGLLHDIGHYPMSHSLKESEELGQLVSHEKLGGDILKGLPQDLADPKDQEQLINIIKGKGGWDVPPEKVANIAFERKSGTDYESRRHNLLHSIIDGPLDTDKMHYLQFDSIHTGNPVGANFDSEQLITSLAFTKAFDGLAVSDKGLASVESFLYARYRMHIDVYWHHTVRGVRKMIARAIDWYISRPWAAARARRARVMEAATRLTDRNFLEWLVTEFPSGEPASQIIGHLIRMEKREGADFPAVARPVRNLFKRFRTYTPMDRGDVENKEIFDMLKPGGGAAIDVRAYEKHVAKSLSSLAGNQIAPWEIIIDIPPSTKEEMGVTIYCSKAQPPAQPYQALSLVSAVAREVLEDFGRNSKKIRIYCSPRVKTLLTGHEAELNANIKCAINDAMKEATEKARKKSPGTRTPK